MFQYPGGPAPASEITGFIKSGGPLTKRISLAQDGSIVNDSSACVMSSGEARRIPITDVNQLAALIEKLGPDHAIALGMLRSGLPGHVKVVTRNKLNGVARDDLIARTASDIAYRPGQPAFALLDYDTKGMPADVAAELQRLGGFWAALVSVMPGLRDVAHVTRRSTSAGLYRTDTGEKLPGSDGLHVYIAVQDGADIVRFLKALHDRCWLAGMGWMTVGAGGQLLERSIVDRSVGGPERLVFEGGPILVHPLEQDQKSRRPIATDGEPLDTAACCPPLTIIEKIKLHELQAKAAYHLEPESAKARAVFIDRQAKLIVERTGISSREATKVVERQCHGILLPALILPFDDPEFANCTVADVLKDPLRFGGATLADPLEGVAYGRGKAKIMLRSDGTAWVNSFAHGRTVYELMLDAKAVRAALEIAERDALVDTLVRMDLIAALDVAEWEMLRDLVAERSGIGKRTIDKKREAERQEQAAYLAKEDSKRRLAERCDPRPQVPVPLPDAPWLPQMQILNDVLGRSTAAIPPMRDLDGVTTQVRMRAVPNMHAFTAMGANNAQDQDQLTLPPPKHWLLSRLDEAQCAELIEQHVDYVEAKGRSVHLPMQFVRHYRQRHDDALPTVVSVSTSPIVLADGTILSPDGLDRQRGIVFAIPEELQAVMPAREDCTAELVAEAMKFLCDDWLCDVSTDQLGKCTIIAAALTIIERSLLPERPVFFVTAGKRGGGKTTTLTMLMMAVTGIRPAAAAWSQNEEERRKALLGYLLEGPPALVWDNIPNGTSISCPHIERSCTVAYYTDRLLGVSAAATASAASPHLFTGNNIRPQGDLISRSLTIRIEVVRTDPENRKFRRPNPIEWTAANRGKILRALYILLLGNPALAEAANAPAKTRFKLWWRLIGSAVENAAMQIGEELDFQKVFVEQEGEDEEVASLADALDILATALPKEFKAADVVTLINDPTKGAGLREIFYPSATPVQVFSAKSVGKILSNHVGEPVKQGNRTLSLRQTRKADGGPRGARSYWVQITTE